jgi:hypothetical protein
MPTLQEDIDDLDRMVEHGTAKHEVRSQIRVIANGVARLEAENASLIEANAKFAESATASVKAYEELKAKQSLPTPATPSTLRDKCPHCQQERGRQTSSRRLPPPRGGTMIKYQCDGCGQSYEKPKP